MSNPLVSVALATYNGERYLEEQLESIYAQSYRPIEVVVSDDCSNDATLEILESFRLSRGLQYRVNDTNVGFVKNFEKAISMCNGAYIALADQDDIWLAEKIEILMAHINDNVLIHSDCALIDNHGNILQNNWKKTRGFDIGFTHLLFANTVTGCCLLFKRDLLSAVLPFPEGIVYHDWWLAVCAADKQKIAYLPQPLVLYRQHEGQDTGIHKPQRRKLLFLENIIARFQNKKSLKYQDRVKQLQNLYALQKRTCVTKEHMQIVEDIICYFEDYLHTKVHLRTFRIGLKYRKLLYPEKNYLGIKNILLDLVG